MDPKAELLSLLVSLPKLETTRERQAFIAFTCPNKSKYIDWEGSTIEFVAHLVKVFCQQGQVELSSFMESLGSSDFVDVERKQRVLRLHNLIQGMDIGTWNTEFGSFLADADTPRTGNELSQPHLFDLRDTAKTLRPVLRTHNKGLVGLAVDCNDQMFFEHFCQRLMLLLNNPSIPRDDVPLAIRPSTHGIPTALKTVVFLCVKGAELGDVIVPVQVGSKPDSYLNFWTQLCTEEKIRGLNHRLVIILHLNANDCQAIEPPLISLGQPICEEEDALEWLERVWMMTNFKDIALKELWQEVICRECRLDAGDSGDLSERLDVAQMYKHMRDMMQLLNESPTQEALKAELMERMAIYG